MKYSKDYVLYISIVLCCLVCYTYCNEINPNSTVNRIVSLPTQYSNKTNIALERWKNAERLIHRQTTQLLKRFIVYSTSGSVPNITQKCMTDIVYVTRGLANLKFWAYRMLDASSRIPSGILEGSFTNMGDFESCLKIDRKDRFKGKFCTVYFSAVKTDLTEIPTVNMEKFLDLNKNEKDRDNLLKHFLRRIHPYHAFFLFKFGVCMPSSCTKNDLEVMIDKASEYAELYWEAAVPHCSTADDRNIPFDTIELAALISVSIVAAIAIIGTLTELYLMNKYEDKKYKTNSSTFVKILMCFSFITNTKKLFKKDDNPESIKVFHGMKTFTILWVMLNHTYNMIRPDVSRSSFFIIDVMTSFSFQVVLNGYPTVDTFFFITGVILIYARMRSSTSKLNVPLYIFRRVLRLGPGVLFVTLSFFILLRMGEGPAWKENSQWVANACRNYWWTNVLFINNMFHTQDQCLGWLWYVGADMQLYLLALVVLIPIKKRPKLGLWILGICSVLSILAIIVNQLYHHLPPTVVMTGFVHFNDVMRLTEKGYYPSYVHAITYCIGMWTGYILFWKPKFKVNTIGRIFGWFTSLLLGFAVVYGVYKWNTGTRATVAESLIYASGSKVAWSVGLAWVVIVSFTGNGGLISRFLSAQPFVPFSRLTYSTYLVHMFIQVYYYFSLKSPIEARHRSIIFLYIAFCVLSFGLAFIFSQLFEVPFMNLEKLMFSSRYQQSSSSSSPKPNGNVSAEHAIQENNINHAFEYSEKIEYAEKGMYVSDTNKANLEYKSEINSSSL